MHLAVFCFYLGAALCSGRDLLLIVTDLVRCMKQVISSKTVIRCAGSLRGVSGFNSMNVTGRAITMSVRGGTPDHAMKPQSTFNKNRSYSIEMITYWLQ